MIYFDNAATTFPKPSMVKEAVDQAITCYGANPGRSGHDLSMQTAHKVYETRSKAAAFFGAESEENVIFTPNCTYALNTVIKGLFRPKAHVLISDMEHNSVMRPLHMLVSKGSLCYTIVQTSMDDDETVDAFCQAIQPDTQAIICTHASNVFGIKLPVARLAKLAHAYGLSMVVDAAQTAGTEPIDIHKMEIDFLCTAGHKGLYGPSGTGLLITPYGKRLRPLVEGGTGSSSSDYAQPNFMPDRLESGTLNTAGILGLGAGFDFIEHCGRENIARYECMIAQKIYSGLSRIPQVRLYTPKPEYGRNLPVFSFNIAGLRSEESIEKLNQKGFALRGGFHCAPSAHRKFGTLESGGTVRVSVGAFNTPEQADRLCDAVKKIAREENG